MMPGAVERHGPVPGYRTGSPRNGLPESLGRGYRFKKQPDWDPFNGVHRDSSVVTAEPRQVAPARLRSRAEKLAEYSEARDAGFTVAEASAYAGVATSTGEKYESGYRAAREQAGGAP